MALSSASDLMIFFNLICVVGSKFAKGSSKITTSGFPIKAPTIPAFLALPFDKSLKYFLLFKISPLKKSS